MAQTGHRTADEIFNRQTQNSIFNQHGDLRADAASFSSDGQIHFREYLDQSLIEWAPEPNGAEHCQQLSRLVEYMATLTPKYGCIDGGPFDVRDQKILHAVGMLYCTGKAQGDHGYEARSAANADRFFREGGGQNTMWAKPEIRDEVCRLIYAHNDRAAINADKRLKVFEDALRFETARLSPNTAEGKRLLLERCKSELFHCGWSRDKANFRAWMLHRGWR